MGECARGMVGQDGALHVEDEERCDQHQADERPERGPAMGGDQRHGSRPAQIVRDRRREDGKRQGGGDGAGHQRRRFGGRHAEGEHGNAGNAEPEARPGRPHAGERLNGGHRQKLEGGPDRGHRQGAQGEEMEGGERKPQAAAKPDEVTGAPQQRQPGEDMEDGGRGKEPERHRDRQQPALGAAEEGRRDAHRSLVRRSLTSPGSPETISWRQPRSASSGYRNTGSRS
jgi:hypothetical protein